jgi:hypothetical protein
MIEDERRLTVDEYLTAPDRRRDHGAAVSSGVVALLVVAGAPAACSAPDGMCGGANLSDCTKDFDCKSFDC